MSISWWITIIIGLLVVMMSSISVEIGLLIILLLMISTVLLSNSVLLLLLYAGRVIILSWLSITTIQIYDQPITQLLVSVTLICSLSSYVEYAWTQIVTTARITGTVVVVVILLLIVTILQLAVWSTN